MNNMSIAKKQPGFRMKGVIVLLGASLLGASLLFALSGCFSPWRGDEGTLTLSLGRSDSARAGGNITAENGNFEHEVILEGPSGTISQKFKKGTSSVSFHLPAGTWNITVRAMGARPDNNGDNHYTDASLGFPEQMLRALGYANDVEIKAGKTVSKQIPMVTATEVTNWEQLYFAFSQLSQNQQAGGKEYILLAGDAGEINIQNTLYVSSDPTLIYNVTLIADKPITLKRDAISPNSWMLFNVYNGGSLTLGMPGMKGRLTIDGNGDSPQFLSGTDPIVSIDSSGGSVTIDGPVTLTNNKTTSTSNPNGGAVSMSGGSFTMNSGEITGNTAAGNGGGVYVGGGTFIMNGGEIAGNSASGNGGGVYVNYSAGATFAKRGGTIYGRPIGSDSSAPGENSASQGRAVFFDTNGAYLTFLGNGGVPYSMANPFRSATAGPRDRLHIGQTGSPTGPQQFTTVDPIDGTDTYSNWNK